MEAGRSQEEKSDSDSGDNLPCGRDDKKDTTRRRDDSGQLSLSLSLVSFRVCNCVHARSNPSLHTHTPKQDLDTVLLVAFWLLVCGSRAVARRERTVAKEEPRQSSKRPALSLSCLSVRVIVCVTFIVCTHTRTGPGQGKDGWGLSGYKTSSGWGQRGNETSSGWGHSGNETSSG